MLKAYVPFPFPLWQEEEFIELFILYLSNVKDNACYWSMSCSVVKYSDFRLSMAPLGGLMRNSTPNPEQA
jgi:hypothetical protein